MLLLLHPFNGIFSRRTWVSQHQKGKPFWILLEPEMMGWQWHQLDHMQIICISLQTDDHSSTSPLSFYSPNALPAAQPTASEHWNAPHNCNKHFHVEGHFSDESGSAASPQFSSSLIVQILLWAGITGCPSSHPMNSVAALNETKSVSVSREKSLASSSFTNELPREGPLLTLHFVSNHNHNNTCDNHDSNKWSVYFDKRLHRHCTWMVFPIL